MENETISNENIINRTENKFKLEYLGQNIKNNKSFLEWEKEMKKIYGNDAKLFKCIEDKIYFYSKANECKEDLSYEAKCPICDYKICYYCSKQLKQNLKINCCAIRRIYWLFIICGMSRSYDNIELNEELCEILKAFVIPIINLIYLIFGISESLFYILFTDKFDSDNNEYYRYKSYIKKNNFNYIIIKGINIAFAITISIPFYINDILFKSIIFLISIGFENRPFRYYFEIIKGLYDEDNF